MKNNNLEFYKSYIGKTVSIHNDKIKVTDVRELTSEPMVLIYLLSGEVYNAKIIRDIETNKFLDDMEKEWISKKRLKTTKTS